MPGDIRFAFRHLSLGEFHPHAFAASAAAKALQDRFWDMHEQALEDDDVLRHADELGSDIEAIERDRTGAPGVESHSP